MVIIRKGDAYALPVLIKSDDTAITAADVSGVRIGIGSIVASYLDSDILPEYKAEHPYTGTFSGKRIHRGIYKAKDGTLINADVNGAANISRKVSGSIMQPRIGLLASPQRIRLT